MAEATEARDKKLLSGKKVLLISLIVILVGCFVIPATVVGVWFFSHRPPSRSQALKKCEKIYTANRDLFRLAAENGDYSDVEKLDEIRGIREDGRTVKIEVGGFGNVTEGATYGIVWTRDEINIVPLSYEKTEDGGYIFRSGDDGDDNYDYVRRLDDNYFFYWEKW